MPYVSPKKQAKLPGRGPALPSTLTLALWHWRQNRLPLALMGIGMIAAVLVACLVPLLWQISVNEVLRNALNAAPDAMLPEYLRDRLTGLSLPLTILSLHIVALILLFVAMMASLLVERQSEIIALLLNRGASGRQIFGSLAAQSVALGLIALLLGPLLALLTAALLAPAMLQPVHQATLISIQRDPLHTFASVWWYAPMSALCAVIAAIASLYHSLRMDALSIHEESANTSGRPLWLRFNLDVAAALLAIGAYALSFYVTHTDRPSGTATGLALLLALIAPTFLLIGTLLIFLRLFPLLLRLGSAPVMRGQRAAPMLALAHMARAPRQLVRMSLLLVLAVAFAIFTLVYTASQDQRVADMAAYQVGADFSGSPPAAATMLLPTLYGQLHGITSATGGYTANAYPIRDATPVQTSAVDCDTFARTASLTTQDSQQSLASSMRQLATLRGRAGNSTIPAIVDGSVWERFHLHAGSILPLRESLAQHNMLPFLVIARMQHIPTIHHGILVDYQTYAAYRLRHSATVPSINHIWLRTSDDPTSLAHVRAMLTSSPLLLAHLLDRRALANALAADPFLLNLLSVLGIGTVIVLALTLMSNLLAWRLSANTRLLNLALLHALQAEPGQISSVLIWEQASGYLIAIILGISFGILFAFTTIPALLLTAIPISSVGKENFSSLKHTLQQTLPVQIIVPNSLALMLVIFIALSAIALSMIVRMLLHPSMTHMLRLDET